MENVAGEQGLALQQLFPYKSSYFSKNSDCHKISFLNDGGLTNLAIMIFSTRFFIVIAHNLMKSRSRDGLAAMA